MKPRAPELEMLMTLAQGGDQRAYAQLLRQTARLLRPFLARQLPSNSALDDLMQEILISIHKARHTYDASRAYAPWAYAIARFRLLDFLRAHYADQLVHAEEWSEEIHSAADVTESALDYESIEQEIQKLPEKQSTILRLMHHQGLTAKQVAEHTGMNESAVKVAAHRAYKILRKILKP